MHQTNNARFLDLLWRHVLSLGLLTVAFLVSYSRYGGKENLHSYPAHWVLLDSWSLWDLTVDLSPRACRAGQGRARGPRPLVLQGQGSTVSSSPVLALSSQLSPGFWGHRYPSAICSQHPGGASCRQTQSSRAREKGGKSQLSHLLTSSRESSVGVQPSAFFWK